MGFVGDFQSNPEEISINNYKSLFIWFDVLGFVEKLLMMWKSIENYLSYLNSLKDYLHKFENTRNHIDKFLKGIVL